MISKEIPDQLPILYKKTVTSKVLII